MSLLNERNPTITNVQELRKAKREQNKIYQKEQLLWIQKQINKIKNFVEDKPSRLAWQTVKEVSGKPPTKNNDYKREKKFQVSTCKS